MKQFLVPGLIAATVLSACSDRYVSSYSGSKQPVNDKISAHAVDSIAKPYREKMQEAMAEVIGYADSSLLSFTPESPLGNFAADAIFDAGFQFASHEGICSDSNAIFSLLNFGGLRTSVSKGAITRGDIYELMPFDNSLVVVKISTAKMDSLVNYLDRMQGKPVSNARFILGQALRGYQVFVTEIDLVVARSARGRDLARDVDPAHRDRARRHHRAGGAVDGGQEEPLPARGGRRRAGRDGPRPTCCAGWRASTASQPGAGRGFRPRQID